MPGLVRAPVLLSQVRDRDTIMTMQPERHHEPARDVDVLPAEDAPNGSAVIVTDRGTDLPASLPSVERKPFHASRLRWWLTVVAVAALAGAALWVRLSPGTVLVRYKTVPVDRGRIVAQGQVIAMLDDKPFRAKVGQAKATLKSARGNLARAQTALAQRRLELDRAIRLRRQSFVSQAELDLARTNYRDAEA